MRNGTTFGNKVEMAEPELLKLNDWTYVYRGAIGFEVAKSVGCPQFPITLTFPVYNGTRTGMPATSINVTALEMRQLAGNLLAVADDIEKQGKGNQ